MTKQEIRDFIFFRYKHVKDYEVGNDVSDKALTFTQLLWPATNKFGVGVAYREDTKITYIVARYSPPGNTKLSEILEHVKKTGSKWRNIKK